MALREGELIAWASAADGGDLFAHHAVVERIFATTRACLPARFDTPITPELLHDRYADLFLALERVEGRAELAVTALWTSSPETRTSGTAYLRARAEMLATAKHVAQQLEDACDGDLAAAEHRELPSAAVALSSALLVERDTAAMIKQRLTLEAQDVRILVNGPWPPYTFAALGAAREE